VRQELGYATQYKDQQIQHSPPSNLIAVQADREFPALTRVRGSVPCSQKHTSSPYFQPYVWLQSTQPYDIYFFFNLILFSGIPPGPIGPFPSNSRTRSLYFLVSHVCRMLPTIHRPWFEYPMAALTQGTTSDTIWASHAEGDAVFRYAHVIR